jgi:RNA polymerase sigma-70 factor (ECF subfamily)
MTTVNRAPATAGGESERPQDRGWTDMADAAQFTEAYECLSPLAVACARRVLRDESAAEDVAQDVFIELWLKPRAFDRRRGTLTTYIAVLARSRALDRYRARVRGDAALERSGAEARALVGPSESAADPVLRRERRRRLLGAIAKLPPEQGAAVVAYGGGYSVPEIARAARVPVGTAKSRVRLGLLKAYESLAPAAVAGDGS